MRTGLPNRELYIHTAERAHSVVVLSLAIAVVLGCSSCKGSDATAPRTPLIPPGTNQSPLASADVAGGGGVSVTAKANAQGVFVADIAVHVVNARPSTTYLVQRAPEIGRALGNDGICQRALGLSPWSPTDPPAPAFVSFILPNATSPVSFTTSAAGEGTVTFEFRAPSIPTGTQFDVMFRLLNDVTAPTSIFQSTCFTVTVL